MRGKETDAENGNYLTGITPAYAGKRNFYQFMLNS